MADGPAPGDVEGISRLLGEIAARSTPTGNILAQGMDDALAAFGMSEWSITTKRLDPAGYEPRRLKGMALSYAVSVRGACHLRATFYKPELGGLLEGLDDDTFVQTYIDWEDRMLLLDSLTMCRFYRDFMSWDHLLSSAGQLNGAPVTKEQLEQLSTETITRIRRLNLAFGAHPGRRHRGRALLPRADRHGPRARPGRTARRVASTGKRAGPKRGCCSRIGAHGPGPGDRQSSTDSAGDPLGDSLAHVSGPRGAAQIVGDPLARADDRAHGLEERVRRLRLTQVAEHQRRPTG